MNPNMAPNINCENQVSSKQFCFSLTDPEENATTKSYLLATRSNQSPTKFQGLVLHHVENLSLTDYRTAIGNLVGPENVLYSLRISKN